MSPGRGPTARTGSFWQATRLAATLVLAGLTWWSGTGSAAAAAGGAVSPLTVAVVSSMPAANARLGSAPQSVRLQFSRPVTNVTVHVLGPNGDRVDLDGTTVLSQGGSAVNITMATVVVAISSSTSPWSTPGVTVTSTLCWTEHGVYGLSIWAAEAPDMPTLCTLVPILPHAQVCRTTAGALRALNGVDLVPTWRAPHYTLVLPDSESDTVEAVRACFSRPLPNPLYPAT